MRPFAATLIPLCSAVGYAFAALMLKRATEGGVGPWRVTFLVNCTAALTFAPWWFWGTAPFEWHHFWHAVLAGATFFIGQILTFLALSRGDISITTPVMGTKVILVAFLAVLLGGDHLSPTLWVAAFLTVAATTLLGGELRANRERVLPSLAFGISAALAYATTDICQSNWASDWGFHRFAPVMFATVGVLSLSLIPFFSAPLSAMPGRSVAWNLGGGLLLSLQATGIAYSIAEFHEVTLTNILYNTRGVWSVLLVWIVGSWFSNTERSVGNRIMARRLAGALLLLAAVFLGLLQR
jgi:drug/metabolite transporter (DMT)-like permease